jgi:hypothetical protein
MPPPVSLVSTEIVFFSHPLQRICRATSTTATTITAAEEEEEDGDPSCIFDDRINTLRCRDEKDFRRVRSSIHMLSAEIKVCAEH